MVDNLKIIQEAGCGVVPSYVMRDKNLSIQAKALYSYISTLQTAGDEIPPFKQIAKELGMGEDTLRKYKKELEEKRYLLTRQPKKQGKFSKYKWALT